MLPEEIARGVCTGRINPYTHQPYGDVEQVEGQELGEDRRSGSDQQSAAPVVTSEPEEGGEAAAAAPVAEPAEAPAIAAAIVPSATKSAADKVRVVLLPGRGTPHPSFFRKRSADICSRFPEG